jgi:hypothetical protein
MQPHEEVPAAPAWSAKPATQTLGGAATAIAHLPEPQPARQNQQVPIPNLRPAPRPASGVPAPQPAAAESAVIGLHKPAHAGAIPGPPMAPAVDYVRVAWRAMRPAGKRVQMRRPPLEPKTTLPGPVLPPQLNSLREAGIRTVLSPKARKAAVPGSGWLVSLFVMIVTLVVGVGVVFYALPNIFGSASATPTEPEPVKLPPAVQQANYSLSRYVEVTGFRFLVDFNQKSEIHYLVINHSAAPLNSVTVFVTLRAADAKAGQPPLSRFSFRSPDLGPYESRDMSSPIERLPRSVSLPDWQNLRADIEISQ